VNYETIAKLHKHFIQAPGVLCGKPAIDDAIKEAQKQLRCCFTREYHQFLQLYGCGVVGAYPIYGLGDTPDAMEENVNVVSQTEWYRTQKWPDISDWYIISTDGRGNPIGIGQDGQVRLSDHDVGDVIIIAKNFEEFLLYSLEHNGPA